MESVAPHQGHLALGWKRRLGKTALSKLQSMLAFIAGLTVRGFDSRRHSFVVTTAFVSPWKIDRDFAEVYSKVRNYTLVDIYRCYELWHLLQQVIRLGGDVLEVGVWRGGTGCILAAKAAMQNKNTKVFLCDTFKGVVKASDRDDVYKGGEHDDTSQDVVAGLVEKLGLTNVQLLAGVFPEETAHLVEADSFCFCHVDVDVFNSASDIVAWIRPYLLVGGVIVFDDYGFHSCKGITDFVDEFVKNNNDFLLIQNLNGHAILIRQR